MADQTPIQPPPLPTIDPALLAQVAARAVDRPLTPDFQVTGWSIEPLRHHSIIETTGGLLRAQGMAWDGVESRPWSAILKLVTQPEDECGIPDELCYWRRELLAYQTGLLADLPEALRAPHCLGVAEQAHGAQIWLEDIAESAPVWSLEDFQRAAHSLGLWAGAYLLGRPRPERPWLCGSLFRGMYADGGWWDRFICPTAPNNAWQRPLVQSVYPQPLRPRVLRIWAEKWDFIHAAERLPQVLCHNDAHRRNLMWRNTASGRDKDSGRAVNTAQELVAIDWSFCGPGALGSDLGQLVGTSLSLFDVSPTQAAELEAAALTGYLAGLRAAGWRGDERLPRLGYLLSLALYWGGTLPHGLAQMQPEVANGALEARYARPLPELQSGWTQLAAFTLARADQARALIPRVLP